MPSRPRPGTAATLTATTVALAALSTGLTACGGTVQHDCVARVHYHGTLYEPRYDVVVPPAATGHPLGTGDIVDCGHYGTLPVVDTATLTTIHNVDPNVAVLIRHSQWRGLYIVAGTKRADWPPALRRATRPKRLGR